MTLAGHLFAYSHDTDPLLQRSRQGLFSRFAYQIDKRNRDQKGVQVQKILELEDEENITAILALTDDQLAAGNGYFVLATERGKIKRIEQQAIVNVRRSGLESHTSA